MTDALLQGLRRLLEPGASFTEISINRLCRESGVPRAQFYAWYEDKGAFIRTVTDDLFKMVDEQAAQWWPDPLARSPDQTTKIGAAVLRLYRENYPIFAALADTAVYDSAVREHFEESLAQVTNRITEVIQQRQADDPTLAALDAAELADILTYTFERTCYRHTKNADDATIDRLARTITSIVLSTIYGRVDHK
ncbi:TetR/AcrR family transcriptional regulator [Nocardia sp. NPDC050630]|uniref:TetR/AcrR family transcriptional regulator n=1 Tax=Nocardia sp. NPDC050630 TaxID=3364321 RepID=UPI00378E4DA1